jgi:hypothetical protein
MMNYVCIWYNNTFDEVSLYYVKGECRIEFEHNRL